MINALARRALTLSVGSGAVALGIWACSTEPIPAGVTSASAPRNCSTPSAGCDCRREGEVVPCGEKGTAEGGNVVCRTGTRKCERGTWGACDVSPAAPTTPVSTTALRPLALVDAGPCVGDPCNPFCQGFQDTAPGVVAGGFREEDGGITLAGNGVCNTRVRGEVRDPAGALPLPNAFVFLREGPLAPFPQGPAPDTCTTILTGGVGGGIPNNRVQTGINGKFDLVVSNVPAGTPIPIVVQIGRWRRQFSVTATCGTVNVPPATSRLPRNQAEGEIPQFALITGTSDTTECLLLKMGIDQAEFTHPDGPGRVHMYYSGIIPNTEDAAPKLDPVADAVEGRFLVAFPTQLALRSILVAPCVGAMKGSATPATQDFYPTDDEVNNVRDFVNAGGRLFTTHLSDMYLLHQSEVDDTAQDMYPGTINWFGSMFTDYGATASPSQGEVLTPDARATQFKNWMAQATVGGFNGSGRMDFAEPRRRALSPGPQGAGWIRNFPTTTPYYHHNTFDTPVGAASKAGRVVHFGSHVNAEAARRNAGGSFPTNCRTTALSSGEKALEYMLFDLASCVGASPPPPAPVYSSTVFTRDFTATCRAGTRVRWRLFNYNAVTPGDSSIQFSAQTADTVAGLAAATSYAVRTASGVAPNPTPPGIVLDANPPATTILPVKASRAVLRISARFNPTSDGQDAPSLFSWTQNFDCEASE